MDPGPWFRRTTCPTWKPFCDMEGKWSLFGFPHVILAHFVLNLDLPWRVAPKPTPRVSRVHCPKFHLDGRATSSCGRRLRTSRLLFPFRKWSYVTWACEYMKYLHVQQRREGRGWAVQRGHNPRLTCPLCNDTSFMHGQGGKERECH